MGTTSTGFKTIIRLPRNKLRLLVAFYTGHCRLKKHMFNMGLASCADCRFCDLEPETPEHLLTNCPAVSRRRSLALGSMFPDRDHITSIAPGSILVFTNALGLNELM